MGIAIPQVITPSKATGAQVIDGSLGFSGTDQKLERTPGSAGNQQTWTWSSWVKINPGQNNSVFSVHTGASDRLHLRIGSSYAILAQNTGSWDFDIRSNAKFRDNEWYHFVCVADFTNSTQNDRAILYVNGERLTLGTNTLPSNTTTNTIVNATKAHYIGESRSGTDFDGRMSQVYLIDGQALDPSYFGFTDPLTNTWKPKKYTGTFGTNGFYLPLDGNSPIGQDKSGNGNDWTPVNFGGSLELDNPNVSGARPILNTTQGGTQATVGVFGSRENVGYAVTVYNDGGGNKYYIDGVKQATLTGLIRGATYTFDTSDSSNSGHPFRFSESDGGSEYTNGVAAITGTATTITIPYNSSNDLYYYCTNHSGMGSSITGITTNEKLADQYAWKNVLALPLVGFRSDVSASIACTSTATTYTVNANVSASSAESNFYNGSFYFDGDATTYLSSSTSETLGTGDWTLEFWYKHTRSADTSPSNGVFLSCSSTDMIVSIDTWGSASFIEPLYTGTTQSGGFSSKYTGTSKLAPHVWNHIAITRTSGDYNAFINGILSTYSSRTNDTVDYNLWRSIGARPGRGAAITGYLQDIRTYKGLVKYTSDFVVPATSPDILPDTPSGVSGGSKLTKITEGTVNFDGSGDYLDAGAVDVAFGSSSDFTIECFVRPRAIGLSAITDPRTSDSSYHPLIWMGGSPGNKPEGVLYYYTGGADRIVGTTVLSVNKWYHVAVVRSNGTTTMYLDGEIEGSFSDSFDYASTTNFRMGTRYNNTNFPFNGFISNMRVVNGTALYTGSRITPPTRALTNVTNTKLLCCQSNTQEGAAAVSPNVSGINNGIQWSRFLNPSDSFTASGRAAGFDGSTGTYSQPATNSSSITFAPPGGITYSTSVEVYTYQSNGVFTTVSDGAQSVSWTDLYQGWKTIASGGGTFTSTTLTSGNPSASDSRPTFAAVRVDSTILVDPLSPYGDAVATTLNPFNTDIHIVRGQETGYATLNPLDSGHDGASITFSDGNLKAAFPSTGGTGQAPASIYVSSGKWYCEYYLESTSDLTSVQYGIVSPGSRRASYIGKSNTTDQYGWEPEIDRAYNNGTNTTPTGKTFTSQWSVAAMALDLDNGTWEMFIDGIPTGTIYSGISGTYTFAIGDTINAGYHTHTANFGQKPFKYAPPDGFQPLNAANVRPVKVISRPDQYVGVATHTGDGGTKSVSIGFKPDLVWIKARNAAYSNHLYDSVRGVTKRLRSDQTAAESTKSGVTAFNSDGFTLGSDLNSNENNKTYVSWCWKAGGNKNTFNVDDVGYASAAAAGIDDGTMTVTGSSVGTKQGFSIVTYTGTNSNESIPHGLDSAPSFYIVKARENSAYTDFWSVYHQSLGKDAYIKLNSTDAASTSSNIWNNTAPTDSLFYVRSDSIANENNIDYVAYLWHDVPGLQKFGTYEGNNSTDGPYIELGFRPSVIIFKNIDSGTPNWEIYDFTERDKTNPYGKVLSPNTTGTESDVSGSYPADALSNGIKIRHTGAAVNAANTYIYMAWAEAPSVDLFGGGANAR